MPFSSTPEFTGVLCTRFDPELALSADELRAVRRCEQAVLGRHFGDAPEDLDRTYLPYREQTGLLRVLAGDRVLAWARLIAPGPRAPLTLDALAGPPWEVPLARARDDAGLPAESTWDIATMGVRRPAQLGVAPSLVTLALYAGIRRVMTANEAHSVVAIIDVRVRDLAARYGLHYQDLPGAFPARYLGSERSVPVYGHMAEILRTQAQQVPALSAIMAGERLVEGLAPVSDDDLRWRDPSSVLEPAVVDLALAEEVSEPR